MSVTSNLPTNREWFRKLLSGKPHQVIGGADDPYLRRWYLIPRNPVINVYLHHFLRSDDDRALHDHPWWFVSVMLRGTYTEITDQGPMYRAAPEPWRRYWGCRTVALRRAEWRHRVQLPFAGPGREAPAWTLIVTGRRSRSWGFWCRNKPGAEEFVHWRDFGDAGCGEVS